MQHNTANFHPQLRSLPSVDHSLTVSHCQLRDEPGDATAGAARALPATPRYAVAITVVDWSGRGGDTKDTEPRVLMVKRGMEPAKGQW